MPKKYDSKILTIRNNLAIFAEILSFFPKKPENSEHLPVYSIIQNNVQACPALHDTYLCMQASIQEYVNEIDERNTMYTTWHFSNLDRLETIWFNLESKTTQEGFIAFLNSLYLSNTRDEQNYESDKKISKKLFKASGFLLILAIILITILLTVFPPLMATISMSIFLPLYVSFLFSAGGTVLSILLGFHFRPGAEQVPLQGVINMAKAGLNAFNLQPPNIKEQPSCFSSIVAFFSGSCVNDAASMESASEYKPN